MTQPHSEVILVAMKTAMEAIHTDSGDSITPEVVQRFDGERTRLARTPSIQITRIRENKSREDGAGAWRVTLVVEVRLVIDRPLVEPEDELDRRVNFSQEDVENALIGMDWTALEANLANLEGTPFQLVDDDELEDGVEVQATIEYVVEYQNLRLVIDPQ